MSLLIVKGNLHSASSIAIEPIIVMGVPITLLVILYRGVLLHWGETFWTDPSYSHGFLVPLISAYLVYTKLSAGGQARTDPDRKADWLGYIVLFTGCALLVAGERATITFIVQLSFLVVIAGMILVLFGRRMMRAMAFPYGFLFFALPLPALVYLPLSFRLQLLSSTFAGWTLDLLGIPALREGNIITLPNVSLQVVEACSGVHSIFALLAIATLAGYLFLGGLVPRLLLALSAAPLAVGLNALRVTLLGVLSYEVSPAAAEGLTHESIGMVLFAIGCILVLAAGASLSRFRRPSRKETAAEPAPPAAPATRSADRFRAIGVSCILVLAMIGFDQSSHPSHVESLRAPLSSFPADLGEWHGRDLSISKAALDSLGTDSVLLREYQRNGGLPIAFYVAFFGMQHEGTTMHSPLHCIPGAGWETEQHVTLPIRTGADDAPFDANEVVFRKGNDRILVLYWYMQQGEVEVSELRGALRTMWDSAVNGRTDGCLIRISSPVTTTTAAALNQQLAILNQVLPILNGHFLPKRASDMPILTAKQ